LWRLFDGERLVGSHPVTIDAGAWEWGAVQDLAGVVRRQADPGRRLGSEAALVAQVGDWLAERVLGPIAQLVERRAPATVRVEVPPEGAWLLGLPLGIATVAGVALARRRVVFVNQVTGAEEDWEKDGVGDRLRVLAVFSVPAGQALLDVRRERFNLEQLVGELVGQRGLGIELRTLQYGATRDKLEDALAEEDGWDVVHFSGHGAPGLVVLETAEGGADEVDTADLIDWLEGSRHRLKLVSLSACSSAAFTVVETLRTLGVTDASAVPGGVDGGDGETDGVEVGGLAQSLVDRLGCAVLAMRYPVVDDFAIELMLSFYESLLGRRQSVPKAFAETMRTVVTVPPRPGCPAISVATPALFGALAVDLQLSPPQLPADGSVVGGSTKMADFKDEPSRFVGRTGVMVRANQALAPRSGFSGVMFHGMAGAGKTWCALELAYGQEANFQRLVWFECPLEGADAGVVADAFTRFARRLDEVLGVALVDKTTSPDRLADVLPVVTEVMQQVAVLVVVDNAESLLTGAGGWLDSRWGALLTALVDQRGLGRLVLTTRLTPTTQLPHIRVEPIHALPPAEAVLLARQLPHLSALLYENNPEPVERGGEATTAGRRLVRRVLEVSNGHPKLLELADAQAAHPDQLHRFLDPADDTWTSRGTPTGEFLTSGDQHPDDNQVAGYLQVLEGWTRQAWRLLSPAAQLLLQVLCTVEPADRDSTMLERNWADIWGRVTPDTPTPDATPLLDELAAAALIDRQPQNDSDNHLEFYGIHPAVTDTTQTDTPAPVVDAVHHELAAYWGNTFEYALAAEAKGEPATEVVVLAARRAVPYLFHLEQWAAASTFLEWALLRDWSPAFAAETIPLLRRVADQTHDSDRELTDLGVLAQALLQAGAVDDAKRLLHQVAAQAADTSKYRAAAAAAAALSNVLRAQGRYREALATIDQLADYTRQAGLGPWTQLSVEGQRLQVLTLMGENDYVLTEIEAIRAEMANLPDPPNTDESIDPFNAREAILDLGRSAAQHLGRSELALDYLGEQLASKRARGAGALEIGRSTFNAYGPLLSLGRLPEARDLLEACREVFERYDDVDMLGRCLSALADVQSRLGHVSLAIAFEQTALRYTYQTRNPQSLVVSHFNLANYLGTHGESGAAIAHRLAAIVLEALIHSGQLAANLAALARDLAGVDPDEIPTSIADLRAIVEQVEGVAFGALVDALGGADDTTLTDLIATARDLPAEQLYADHIARWEPALMLLTAARHGHPAARAALDAALEGFATNPDWVALVAVLRRVADGDTDRNQLLAGLDPIDTTITTRALDAVQGEVHLDPIPDDQRVRIDAVIALARHQRHPDTPVDDDTVATANDYLDALAATDAWRELAGQLRALTTGQPDVQADRLDPTDTAIALWVLQQLDQPS
jgi:tetratricopeptide (TPR) repeat protein